MDDVKTRYNQDDNMSHDGPALGENSIFMRGVGFINPGPLEDRLPRQGSTRESKNNRAKGRSSNQPEGLAQEEQRPLLGYFGPLIRPELSIRAPAASGRPLRSEGLPRALLPTPTPRLSDRDM